MNALNTTININGDGKVFKYVIEALPSENHWVKTSDFCWFKFDKTIHLFNDNINYVKYSSYWGDKTTYIDNISQYSSTLFGNSYIPDKIKILKLRVYFPLFSPDIYTNIKYMITVSTTFNGHRIDLGSYLLDRIDALAIDHCKKYNDCKYFEYCEFDIIDPRELVMSNEWEQFRNIVCKNVDSYDLLRNESILNFSLHPIEYSEDKYIQNSHYYGGQNSINISNINDYLNLNLKIKYTEEGVKLACKVGYKEFYDNLESLLKYQYGINNPIYKSCILVLDRNDYNMEYFSTIEKESYDCEFDKYELTDYYNSSIQDHFKLFDSWNNWKPGLVFIASLSIWGENSESPIIVLSNDIPITQELFKYLIIDPQIDINHINLDKIDMKCYNISAVNKIVNNIVQIDKPNDSKSNIVQPIFFKSQNAENILIHPEVTENICINLDRYKSKVNNFILKVEGAYFKQISSTSQGIIFKIIGNNLPNKKTSGVYYILDDNYELVTSGKYTYEQ